MVFVFVLPLLQVAQPTVVPQCDAPPRESYYWLNGTCCTYSMCHWAIGSHYQVVYSWTCSLSLTRRSSWRHFRLLAPTTCNMSWQEDMSGGTAIVNLVRAIISPIASLGLRIWQDHWLRTCWRLIVPVHASFTARGEHANSVYVKLQYQWQCELCGNRPLREDIIDLEYVSI